MLTSLRIRNFKSWRDTGDIRLAPLTFIFGPNSAGKSSLGHLLLALKQTALSSDRQRTRNLGDGNTLIDLGTFADCLYGHDLSQPLDFHLRWMLPKQMTVRNPGRPADQYNGDSLDLQARLKADEKTG